MPDPVLPRAVSRSSDLPIFVVILLATFAALWVFCSQTGALQSDLGGDPDEAAHAVTSLMIRDYLVDGLGQMPMKFARDYYEHYPRVALGHFPPFYYLVAGAVLVIRDSPEVLFLLQAFLMAVLAAQTWLLGRRFLPSWLAAVAAMLGCALPLALKLVQHIMSDVLLAVLCLWAVFAWVSYLRGPTIKRALWWGCIAAAAILTKGSGMLLCVLPPMATLLTGQWRLIKTPSWWCAALPVGVLAGPWMIYSTKISKEGMTDLTPAQYVLEAIPYYLDAMPQVFGWGLTVLAIFGILVSIRHTVQNHVVSAEAATLWALMTGTSAILVLVPVGLTTRYLLTLMPVVMLAAAYGAAHVMRFLSYRSRLMAGTVILLAGFSLVAALPVKDVHGFAEAARLAGPPTTSDPAENWLISSDPRGEGAVVAAGAFQSDLRAPSHLHVYRGGQQLAASDWMGRGYKTAVETPEALLRLLDERNITWVMVDLSVAENLRRSHDRLLEQTLQSAGTSWKLVREQEVVRRPGQKGRLLVYQRQSGVAL
ncbi:MAG: glycosyltransferase family 39 protein [Verrucomicrobiota bacterium]